MNCGGCRVWEDRLVKVWEGITNCTAGNSDWFSTQPYQNIIGSLQASNTHTLHYDRHIHMLKHKHTHTLAVIDTEIRVSLTDSHRNESHRAELINCVIDLLLASTHSLYFLSLDMCICLQCHRWYPMCLLYIFHFMSVLMKDSLKPQRKYFSAAQ